MWWPLVVDHGVFGPKSKSFEAAVEIPAPLERVWAARLDSLAPRWIIHEGALAAAVPGEVEAIGALRCGWRQTREGSLATSVYEIVELEQERRLVLLARHRAYLDSRLEFQLRSNPEGTRVDVQVTEQRQRTNGPTRKPQSGVGRVI